MSNRPPKGRRTGSAGSAGNPSGADARTVRPGVRGPGGPPQSPPVASSGRGGSRSGGAPAGSRGTAAARQPRTVSPARRRFEELSLPLLRLMHGAPRWIVVVGMATLLFLGLIQSGSLAWLGGLLLLIVAAFLGWLLALSWPAISPAARWLRVFVVAALVGVAILKLLGRFNF